MAFRGKEASSLLALDPNTSQSARFPRFSDFQALSDRAQRRWSGQSVTSANIEGRFVLFRSERGQRKGDTAASPASAAG